MSWFPANNQYDGVNSAPVNYAELNAPFYIWDFIYTTVSPVVIYAPLLTSSPGGFDPTDPEGERVHDMRVMIVPPERGRSC